LTGVLGFRKIKPWPDKEAVRTAASVSSRWLQEYIAGRPLYGLAKRHDLYRQLEAAVGLRSMKPDGLDADARRASA